MARAWLECVTKAGFIEEQKMTNRLFTENKNIKENVKNDIFLKQQVERIKSDSEKF